MKTAEEIINEYLGRGYSIESLRILAESREKTLRAEMTAILDRLERPEAPPESVPPESALPESVLPEVSGGGEAGASAETDGDAVFFVADDESTMADEGGGVDFDLMAETAAEASAVLPPVALEESVANIVIGETSGADLVTFVAEAVDDLPEAVAAEGPREDVHEDTSEGAAEDMAEDGAGVWSRLWSRVLYAKRPAFLADESAREAAPESEPVRRRDIFSTPIFEEAVAAAAAAAEPTAEGDEPVRGALVEESCVLTEVSAVADVSVSGVLDVAAEVFSAPGIPVGIEPAAEFVPEAESTEDDASPPVAETAESMPGVAADAVEPEAAFANLEMHAETTENGIVEALEGADVSGVPDASGESVLDDALGDETVEIAEVSEVAECNGVADGGGDVRAAEPSAGECAAESLAENLPSLTESEMFADIGVNTEVSADYIPCSISSRFETDSELAGNAAEDVAQAAEPDGSAMGGEVDSPVAGAADSPDLERAEAGGKREGKASRRERRRLERAEKKKQKRGKKKPAAELSEAVPARSEETEAPVPESGGVVAEMVEGVDWPVVDADAFSEEPIAPGAVVDAETAPEALVAEQIDQVVDAEAAEEPVASPEEDAFAVSEGGAHLMIIANGGVSADELAELEAANGEAPAEIAPEADGSENNVILFREMFPVFSGELVDEDDGVDVADGYGAVLRMLPPPEAVGEDVGEPVGDEGVSAPDARLDDTAAPAAVFEPEEALPVVPVLDDAGKRSLLLALAGEIEDPMLSVTPDDASMASGSEHVIVGVTPEAPSVEELLEREAGLRLEVEREAGLRLEMERECQARVDQCTAQVIGAQEIVSQAEARTREKEAELDAAIAKLAEMQNLLGEGEAARGELLRQLEALNGERTAGDEELTRLRGIQDEHRRLFAEFEDLRSGYNEIVTDVMPGLQNERDELALTVERQCQNEKTLRSNLGSARRRLAVGYTLAAASCLLLIALPVANWLKSDSDSRQLAVEHQQMSELRETLDVRERENVAARNRVVELERKMGLAREELARLQAKNQELAAAAAGTGNVAVYRPASDGVPTRASTMALQAAVQPGGALHHNDVMDPAGSIEQLAEMNRERNRSPLQPQMADARGRAIPVDAVAMPGNDVRPSSLQPPMAQANVRRAPLRPASGPAVAPGADATVSPGDLVVARVRKGEGVAQVVYRVLGTRDPEIIAWVIQENGIRPDRRGNPIIQPNQELRLPKDGRIVQSASLGWNR